MTDSVGPGKLVCHMQNPSYAYDRLSLSYASLYVIALGTSLDIYIYKSQNSERICLAGLLLYMYLSAEKYQTMQTEFCPAERNSAHVLVSAGISRLLDACLSGIHNANYIVNSIVCRGSRVPAYGIRSMHGPIHVLDMHGTWTKHIARHSQKSVVQRSVISEFTCIQGSTLRVTLWPQASKNSPKQLRASKKRPQLVLQGQ